MTAVPDPPSFLRRPLRLPLSRRGLAALLAFIAMSVLLFADAVLGGRVLFRRDIAMVWLPLTETFVRGVASGSLPLWDPYSGYGRPLLADPRAEVLYPPTWLNLILLPGTYFTIFVVAHLVFSACGMYLLARHWRASVLGAFTAGALWIASGPFLSLASMWHHLAAAAWIPWIFFAGDAALGARTTRPALVFGAVIAAQVFAGSPELTVLTLAAFAAYAVVYRWAGPPRADAMRSLVRPCAIAAVFGLALSAVQWVPTLEVARRSARTQAAAGTRNTWSLDPLDLLEVAIPLPGSALRVLTGGHVPPAAAEPWLHSIYLGVAGLALAASGIASPLRRNLFLAALAAVCFLVALGEKGLLLEAAARIVPPLRMFRYPAKAMVLAAFAWSALAGRGVDAWRERAAAVRPAAWVAALAGTFGLAGLQAAAAGGFPLAPFAALLLLATATFAVAQARLRTSAPGTATLMAALAVGAPLLHHRDLHWTAPRELLTYRPPALDLVERSDGRLYVYDYSMLPTPATDPNQASVYGPRRIPMGWSPRDALFLGALLYMNPPTAARWGVLASYDFDILDFEPPAVARLKTFLRESEGTPAHLRLLQLGAVGHVMALAPAAWWAALEPVSSVPSLFANPIQVLRVPDPLPRSYVVDGVRIADGEAALKVLVDQGFDPRLEVVLPTGVPRSPGAEFQGRSRILEVKPDRVRLEAELTAPGFLVLVDGYDEGWRARVDGRDAFVHRANVAFRAVLVPAGKHQVEFRYRPRAALTGLLVSLAALAGVLALAAHRLVRGPAQGTA